MTHLTRVLAVLPCVGALVLAQSFNYANFTSASGIVVNQNALVSGANLRVTPSALSQRGTAFYGTPVSVVYGFDTTFTFSFTSPVSGGGDGLAFIIQNDPRGTAALGNHASAMGYGAFATSPAGTAIANSIAIELDTYMGGAAIGDLSGNEVSVHTNGIGDNLHFETYSIGRVALATPNMSSGVHTARIQYVPGTLKIYIDNLTVPVLTVPYDFTSGGNFVLGGSVGGLSLLAGEYAWVGFAASGGAAYENHDVHSWTWASPLPGSGFTGSVGVGAGGPYDVVKVNGSAGGLLRDVTTTVGSTFSIGVDQPPTTASPTGFYLAGVFGRPAPNALFSLPIGIGDMCFVLPFPSATATEFIVAESFGFNNAMIPATLTPWSVSIAGGLPFAIQLTFQGVVEESPGVFRTTNAVTLNIL